VTEPADAPILEFDSARDAVIEPAVAITRFDLLNRAVLCFFADAIPRFVEERGWVGHSSGRDLLLRLAVEAVLRIDLADRASP
jgi:hypothetical protein